MGSKREACWAGGQRVRKGLRGAGVGQCGEVMGGTAEEEAQGRLHCPLQPPEGEVAVRCGQVSFAIPSMRRLKEMALSWDRGDSCKLLEINFSLSGIGTRCPRGVLKSPSLEVFKRHLDLLLGGLEVTAVVLGGHMDWMI